MHPLVEKIEEDSISYDREKNLAQSIVAMKYALDSVYLNRIISNIIIEWSKKHYTGDKACEKIQNLLYNSQFGKISVEEEI